VVSVGTGVLVGVTTAGGAVVAGALTVTLSAGELGVSAAPQLAEYRIEIVPALAPAVIVVLRGLASSGMSSVLAASPESFTVHPDSDPPAPAAHV
jgi:hypothetical protein